MSEQPSNLPNQTNEPAPDVNAEETKNEEGKTVSKNEQKRLAKVAQKEKEKAEKDALKKANEKDQPPKKKPVEEEEIKDPTAYYENRCKFIETMRNHEKYAPYPHKFEVSHSIAQFIKEFDAAITEKTFLDKEVSIAGISFNTYLILFDIYH